MEKEENLETRVLQLEKKVKELQIRLEQVIETYKWIYNYIRKIDINS